MPTYKYIHFLTYSRTPQYALSGIVLGMAKKNLDWWGTLYWNLFSLGISWLFYQKKKILINKSSKKLGNNYKRMFKIKFCNQETHLILVCHFKGLSIITSIINLLYFPLLEKNNWVLMLPQHLTCDHTNGIQHQLLVPRNLLVIHQLDIRGYAC